MNTRIKGRRNEKKAKSILEKEGYVVVLTPMPQKFKKEQDMANLWDIIAIRHDTVRFIQVKTNKKIYGKALLPYVSFRCPLNCSREIWTFYDRVKEPEIKYL